MRKIFFIVIFVNFSMTLLSSNSYSSEVTTYLTEDRANEIRIIKNDDSQYMIHIYASYSSANGMVNVGELDGVGHLSGNTMSVFSEDFPDCRVAINFFDKYIDVSGGASNCGFGLNVSADGRYYLDAKSSMGENSVSVEDKSNVISIVKNSVMNIDATTTLGNAIEGYEYFDKTYWEKDSDKQKREIVRSCSVVNKNFVMEYARKNSMDPSKAWVGILSKYQSTDPKTIHPEQSEYEELFVKFGNFYLFNDFSVSVDGQSVVHKSTKLVITDQYGGTIFENVVEDGELIRAIYKNDMFDSKGIW